MVSPEASARPPARLDCEFRQPDVLPIAEDLYRLDEAYCYCWFVGDVQNRIHLPEGYTYDGASVPRLVWTLSGIRPDGLIRAAALVHDWIYGFAGRLPEGSHQYKSEEAGWSKVSGRWRRRESDRLFARMMREAGVSRPRRRLAYLATRVFGGPGWDS